MDMPNPKNISYYRANDTMSFYNTLTKCLIFYLVPFYIFKTITPLISLCYFGFMCYQTSMSLKNLCVTMKNSIYIHDEIATFSQKYLNLCKRVEYINDTWGLLLTINLFFIVSIICIGYYTSTM